MNGLLSDVWAFGLAMGCPVALLLAIGSTAALVWIAVRRYPK